MKKNIYKALCYYYPTPSSEQLLSALLDSRCKKLEFVNFLICLDVENKLRELYKEKKHLRMKEKKEKTKLKKMI